MLQWSHVNFSAKEFNRFMKSFTKILAVSAAAAMLLSGCTGLFASETDEANKFAGIEEMEAYITASADETLSGLTEYLMPTNIPEGMTLTNCEI